MSGAVLVTTSRSLLSQTLSKYAGVLYTDMPFSATVHIFFSDVNERQPLQLRWKQMSGG
jgi:hypothetical protein